MAVAASIKWIVTSSGDHRELILADSSGEARRIFEEIHAEPPLAVRLHSGFPRLFDFDLVFGETVFPRDLFPSPNSDGWIEVRNQEQLDRYLRSVPAGAEFVPPFRRTPTCHGQWKCEDIQEGRKRFAASKLEAIERDRLAGLSCE